MAWRYWGTEENPQLYGLNPGDNRTHNINEPLILEGHTKGALRSGTPVYWYQSFAPFATITNTGPGIAIITDLAIGVYAFKFKATNFARQNMVTDLTITVTNSPPPTIATRRKNLISRLLKKAASRKPFAVRANSFLLDCCNCFEF